jgi:hypothetical protein
MKLLDLGRLTLDVADDAGLAILSLILPIAMLIFGRTICYAFFLSYTDVFVFARVKFENDIDSFSCFVGAMI